MDYLSLKVKKLVAHVQQVTAKLEAKDAEVRQLRLELNQVRGDLADALDKVDILEQEKAQLSGKLAENSAIASEVFSKLEQFYGGQESISFDHGQNAVSNGLNDSHTEARQGDVSRSSIRSGTMSLKSLVSEIKPNQLIATDIAPVFEAVRAHNSSGKVSTNFCASLEVDIDEEDIKASLIGEEELQLATDLSRKQLQDFLEVVISELFDAAGNFFEVIHLEQFKHKIVIHVKALKIMILRAKWRNLRSFEEFAISVLKQINRIRHAIDVRGPYLSDAVRWQFMTHVHAMNNIVKCHTQLAPQLVLRN